LQKIAIDEPSIEETVKILAGLRTHGAHHGVTYTDAALGAAAKLAARHLRDYRLPDSAIDLVDEAGSVVRLSAGSAEPGTEPGTGTPQPAAVIVDAPDIERVVARMARIPARQASSSDRERLRELEETLEAGRVRPARGSAPGGAGDQAIARRPRPTRAAGRLLPVHGTYRRRENGAGEAAGDPAR
jgi:ATP-dependent Clp protease ATP-binding subunit ClpA